MAKLTDNSPMPFGKYKGKAMANIPAPYLLYLHEQGCSDPAVKHYLVCNLDILNRENSKIQRR
ncbi:putative quorum-sensing-regulated virulence factor [Dyadobacter endophyticus]|uniref:putative quorum-sensing-regulated virulence factor n=1 Tax=Dyadobacter endophyticus TaxID=1749036 RepID=UPI003CEE9B69